MLPSKFISWALDGVPALVNWFKKKGRINAINSIENDARAGNNASDDKRLSDAFKKYDNDVKSAS
jgi:hypothetical protein